MANKIYNNFTSFPTTDENGVTEWRNEKGQLHRDDGPAVEHADGHQEWWYDGKKSAYTAKRGIGPERESMVARLEDAIKCAKEIKKIATWEWAIRTSDQLIDAAKTLRDSIKHSDKIIVHLGLESKEEGETQ